MKTRDGFTLAFLGLGLAFLPAAVISHAQDSDPQQGITSSQNYTGMQGDYSHARIVRLSFVEGTVTLQRPDIADWAAAPINTPIQEGFKLSTAEKSFAEVEFENTSTARLGQDSLVDFNQLVITPSGGKVNRLTLEQGYATFNVNPEGVDTFEVKAQDTTITLAATATTRFRVDLDQGAMRVEVFKGAADVSSPYGQQTLTKDMVLDIRPGTEQAFNTSQGITKDSWDQWVDERDNQESVVRNSPTPSVYSSDNSNSYYGWNDLSNYGNWNYFPGSGYGWAPMAAYDWSPFSVGRWCWYPGFGFTWISSEPWGWLPFHYGGWLFQPGFGWTWFPSSFGNWSPGNVNWSQGSGWVGWSPMAPQGTSGRGVCAPGQNCGRIIVRPEVLREGKPIRPSSLVDVNLADGRPVARPNILPSRAGMLPGAPVAQAASFAPRTNLGGAKQIGNNAQITSGRNTVVIGETSAARPSASRPGMTTLGAQRAPAGETGVAFDPASGRFVNSNMIKPSPVTERPGAATPGNQTEEHSASPILNLGAAPVRRLPSSQIDSAAPTREPPSYSHETAAPAGRSPHSEAPVYRPSSPNSSGSHFGGGSRSTSSEGSRSSSYGGGRSGGGASGMIGSSGGGSRSGGGGSTGGGSHSSGTTTHPH
jgi:hypothetical protein